MGKRIRLASAAILVLAAVAGALSFVYFSTPLQTAGAATRIDEDGRQEIVIHLYNEGIRPVTLKKVYVNGRKTPEPVSLGVTYDNGQLVQIDSGNPAIQFTEIDAVAIRPRLTGEEFEQAVRQKNGTPVHYGIRISDSSEPISRIRLVYEYFGITVSKNYSFDIPY